MHMPINIQPDTGTKLKHLEHLFLISASLSFLLFLRSANWTKEEETMEGADTFVL